MIYKSERNVDSNDPRLPVVDAIEECNRLDVLLNDDDDDDETSDEDYNEPLMASSSNRNPPKMGRTRKTPPAKVSLYIFEQKKMSY